LSQVTERFNFYRFTIKAVLEALGVPLSRVRFVQESSYVTTPAFIQDQWRMHNITPIQDIIAAGGSDFNPLVLGPMYGPSLRTLAEEYLDVDVQIGGANQVSTKVSR
jgi:tyrosyl-tRNA synthetase